MLAIASDKYVQSLTESLWSVESWFKVVFLLVTAPVWYPIVKSMLHEMREVLAPEGGLYATKKPRPIAPRTTGEDPFLNIPYAEYRAMQRARKSQPNRSNVPHREITPAARRGGSSAAAASNARRSSAVGTRARRF